MRIPTNSSLRPLALGLCPTISSPRFDQEAGAAASAANGSGAPPPNASAVDASSPAFQAALAVAVQRATAEVTAEKERILANERKLLDEKKKWDDIGRAVGDPDKVKEILAAHEKAQAAAAANAVGADPDRFAKAVEEAAQAKYNVKAQELSAQTQSLNDKIKTLDDERQALQKLAHRRWVAYELAKAAPKGTIQEGAHDMLIDRLSEVLVAVKVDGVGEVARLKVGGVFVPGGGPDGLMTPEEFVAQARLGKGPVPNLGFFFVSNGQGSNTTDPKATGAASGAVGKNWWKMTEPERTEFINKNGSVAARELIDNSGPQPARAAAAV